jgi:hypothetical protein
MEGIPHLHGSVSGVERLADFLVRFPIFLLTDLGAVHDGLASTAVRERDTFWCSDVAEVTGLGHGYARSVKWGNVRCIVLKKEIPWKERFIRFFLRFASRLFL